MANNNLSSIQDQHLDQLRGHHQNGKDSMENQESQQEEKLQQEEMKHVILSQVLDQQARGRLNTLKLSKPTKADMLEKMIIRMAHMGQIRDKLDDGQFVRLLENVNAQMPQSVRTVKYDRRRAAIDSDDEDYGC